MEPLNQPVAVIDNTQRSPAERIRSLKAEAQALVATEVRDLQILLEKAALLAADIIDAGDVASPGVRELCRSIHDDLGRKATALAGFAAKSAT